MMKPERWQKVDRVFQSALERGPEERARFIDEACRDDDSLRREVEALLAADLNAGSLIDSPAYTRAAPLIAANEESSLLGKFVGHYRIISLVGKGGMSEVYRARDLRLNREVAVKVLPQAFLRNPERMRRFEREAHMASALNHPNIITVHEIGEVETEAGNTHYIVTEYVDGETLRRRISAGKINLSEALDLVSQVASALSAAHTARIIHRDIKPENVMVRPDGLVKVLDFGLAKLSERPEPLPEIDLNAETTARQSTEIGVVMGTVNYMSPEQARGQKMDQRTDIFSLGAVLYEMLAGRRPFEGATKSDVIAALLTAEPAPLKQYCPDAATELEYVIGRCLAKNREDRYRSAEDLIIDLKRLQAGSQAKQPAAKRRFEAVVGSWRWPFIAALFVVLCVVLVYLLVSRLTPAAQSYEIRSLAVLPLENLSGDPAQDYFADGMTETLIAGLARVGALRVSSRTSVMQYKETLKMLPDIARELSVDAVVEGSVQRVGDRVKISARLIHAPTERYLWSETYERDLRDALAIQSEIARAIIQQIQIKLTPQEQMRLANPRPVDPAAYDDYLRGRFYFNLENKADNETSIRMLERAVATDPSFAAAHAELAQAYANRFFLFTPDEKQWKEKAFIAVEKALSLDPNLASAYLARGRFLWTPSNHFPHDKAVREFRHALALNPSLDEAQNWLALIYNHIGNFDQALQELQKAVTVNPTNTAVQFRIGQTLVFQGKYEQALTALRSIPKEANPRVGYLRALAELHLGKREEAAAIAEEFLAAYPDDADGGLLTCFQALLAALAGDVQTAEGKIRSAIEKGKGFGHFHHTAYDIACAYSLMKKIEPAMKWLQRAADDGFPCYPLFERDPFLHNLRKDPRSIDLMAKLKKQWEYYQTRLSSKVSSQ